MADHPSSHWALKITATAGSDLNVAEKLTLAAYERTNLLHPGLVARVSHVEILNRETGQSGAYAFVGIGVGFGAGIISADLGNKWHPFDTKEPIALEEFGTHAATLYNMSAGLGFNWAPVSGIRFDGIDIHHDSKWESFWHGNGISVGGATTVNAGTSLDMSEVGGRLFTIHQEEGNRSVIEHLDEINQICAAYGLGETHIHVTPEDGTSRTVDANPGHVADSAGGPEQATDSTSVSDHHVAAHPGQELQSTPSDVNYNDPSGHATHVDANPGHVADSAGGPGHVPDISSSPDMHGATGLSHT
jgi:hypothetical protein